MLVTWPASRSHDVKNVNAGGHRVYYSHLPGSLPENMTVVDVPNTQSQTQIEITGLMAGCTYYVRVGAYSAINTDGGELSVESAISL